MPFIPKYLGQHSTPHALGLLRLVVQAVVCLAAFTLAITLHLWLTKLVAHSYPGVKLPMLKELDFDQKYLHAFLRLEWVSFLYSRVMFLRFFDRAVAVGVVPTKALAVHSIVAILVQVPLVAALNQAYWQTAVRTDWVLLPLAAQVLVLVLVALLYEAFYRYLPSAEDGVPIASASEINRSH